MKPPTPPPASLHLFDRPTVAIDAGEDLWAGTDGRPPHAADTRLEVECCLDLLKAHELDGLRERLMRWERQEGLANFVTDLVAPLNTRVGDAWMRGDLQIFEEHAYAELVQVLLHQAMSKFMARGEPAGPRILMSTLPGEPHGLGLLMAEAMFRVAGAHCIPLGVQTPVWDLVCAAAAYRCDIVAIGFSGSMNPNHVVAGLTELRTKLPTAAALWVGGTAPALHRRRIDGVTPLAALADIGRAVERWRASRAGPVSDEHESVRPDTA